MSIELLILGMMLVTFIPRYLPFALAGASNCQRG